MAKIVEVPVEKEVIVYKEIPIEKIVERVVEEEVEIPYKVVTYIDKPIYIKKNVEIENPLVYENKNKALTQLSYENEKLIETLTIELGNLETEYKKLMAELESKKEDILEEEVYYGYDENLELR